MGIEELVTSGVLEQRFDVGPVIGQGAYSTVRLATEKGTKKKVAIKYIEKARAFGDMNLETECRLLRDLGRHPNINAFLGLYVNSKYYMIVLEYMQGGELLDILIRRVESNSTPYSEAQVAVIMRQIVAAVEHCHKHNIIHRDLKPENILVSDEVSLGSVNSMFNAPIKVADFGLACEIQPGQKLRPTCGTPNYMAPERLSRKPYDCASDIWSIGVIMYILLAGTFPFYGETDDEIRTCACNPNEPDYAGAEFRAVSKPCLELVRDRLLAKDPAKRPTAADLLNHPWMTGELASTSELSGALKQLKRFNARRKFRAGVKALVASKRLQSVLGGLHTEQLVVELTQFGIRVQNVLDLHKIFGQVTKRSYMCDKTTFVDTLEKELEIPKRSLLEALFDSMKNPGGMVNTRDFCLSLATKIGTSEDQTLQLCFNIYDADGSGTIDQKEYADMVRSILKSLGDTFAPNDLWLQQEFEDADVDGSGSISLKEFLVAAKSNIKIQAYLRNVGALIRSKNNEQDKVLNQKMQTKAGELFIKKDSMFGGGWKERYASVVGMNMMVYKDEADCKAKRAPKQTFDLIGAKFSTNAEKNKKRNVMRMKLDLGRPGSYLLEAQTDNELKVWVQIFRDLGLKSV